MEFISSQCLEHMASTQLPLVTRGQRGGKKEKKSWSLTCLNPSLLNSRICWDWSCLESWPLWRAAADPASSSSRGVERGLGGGFHTRRRWTGSSGAHCGPCRPPNQHPPLTWWKVVQSLHSALRAFGLVSVVQTSWHEGHVSISHDSKH